ncbi:MAG: NUDIX hydrolase [Gemmatimonadaceae bacterium]
MTTLARLRSDPRIARLEAALATRDIGVVEDPGARRAAVSILIRLGENDEPEIFFIKRSLYEGDPWSGQIAFPGGREEPGDEDLFGTACREAMEEVEFDLRREATLIGTLDDLRPRTVRLPDIVVRPFVCLMPAPPDPVLSLEVADSFWVPLSVLLDRSVWRDATVSAGGMEMSRFAFHHHGYVVWGMTERILSGLVEMFGE